MELTQPCLRAQPEAQSVDNMGGALVGPTTHEPDTLPKPT
jgi:hypothetical protein